MQEEEERKREAEQRIGWFMLPLLVFHEPFHPEEKRRELEEAGRQEEKLLADARRRSGTGGQTSPPPLPSSPPPRDSPPPPASSSSNATPGTTRLDMLLGEFAIHERLIEKRLFSLVLLLLPRQRRHKKRESVQEGFLHAACGEQGGGGGGRRGRSGHGGEGGQCGQGGARSKCKSNVSSSISFLSMGMYPFCLVGSFE